MTTPNEGTTPRPWWFEDGPHIVHGTRHVLSRGGGFSHRAVASIVTPPDAALIVAAVNDYDRLRAIEAAAHALVEAFDTLDRVATWTALNRPEVAPLLTANQALREALR